MIPLLFICYPKCTTCQKAQAWLTERGVCCQFRDIKVENPSAAELAAWREKSGLPLRTFFNASGTRYKELGLAARLAGMAEDEQLVLLASDGMLVRRPIVVAENFVLVGFKLPVWEAAFASNGGSAQ